MTERLLTVVCLCLLAGCAALRGTDEARERREARADHAACVADGHAYPGDDYERCRRRLADRRLQEQWLELSMTGALTRERDGTVMQTAPAVPYRPLDPARFGCVRRAHADGEWIACRER